jgi:hypothetical protein
VIVNTDMHANDQDAISDDLAKGVQELQVKGVKRKEYVADSWKNMRERVSFGTNISSDHDLFDDEAKGPVRTPNMLAAERFMAHKCDGNKAGMHPTLTPAPKKIIEKPQRKKAISKRALEASLKGDEEEMKHDGDEEAEKHLPQLHGTHPSLVQSLADAELGQVTLMGPKVEARLEP